MSGKEMNASLTTTSQKVRSRRAGKWLPRILVGALLGATLMSVAPAHAAGNSVVDCTPTRVRTTADRMDMMCMGNTRWFVAWRNSTNAEHMNQMIALVNSAIATGKTLKLYYDVNSSNNGILWGVELFR